MGKITKFEDIEVWQDARLLAKEIYRMTESWKDFSWFFRKKVKKVKITSKDRCGIQFFVIPTCSLSVIAACPQSFFMISNESEGYQTSWYDRRAEGLRTSRNDKNRRVFSYETFIYKSAYRLTLGA